MFGLGTSPQSIQRLGARGNAVKLAKLLKHKNEEVRANAAKALGDAPSSDESVNALVAALSGEPSKAVLINVITSLGSVGTSPTLEHLKYLRANQSDADVEDAIAQAVTQIHKRVRN